MDQDLSGLEAKLKGRPIRGKAVKPHGLSLGYVLAAERDPSNDAGRAASSLCKELVKDTGEYMEAKQPYFGGLKNPVLLGSDQFRQEIGSSPGNYFNSLLISCDFSGR